MTVLSNSPLVNTENGQADTQNGAIYTAPSGARVFAASSIQFSWGLDNWGGNTFANAGVQQMTSNILNNFSTSSGTPGPTVPNAPTGVGGTPGDSSVALSWTAPASDGGSPISSYRITPYIGATAQTAIVTGSTATTRSITGLTNGTAYTFKVAAINGDRAPAPTPQRPPRSRRRRRDGAGRSDRRRRHCGQRLGRPLVDGARVERRQRDHGLPRDALDRRHAPRPRS